MNSKQFDELVNNRISKTIQTLVIKAKEYASDTDRLHNFNKAGNMSNQSREKALKGFLLKHIVSLDDIIENLDKGIIPSKDVIDEKIGDIINYHILIEACIIDRINSEEDKVNGDKQ